MSNWQEYLNQNRERFLNEMLEFFRIPSISSLPENIERLRDAGGAVPFGLTTASEFGGVNLTRTVLNGATHNPWQHDRTPGGSSGGSAAAA